MQNSTTGGSSGGGSGGGISGLMIPLYILIFLLAVVGNSLVIVTLARNRRMRTVTNVYLLNLVSFSF
ncbi:unnamed protein product [Nezara viridula]|uniref:G-protein coupled receptors family 1 profile domain-containing protein n=1 Tax=Nezara viridula TaxID=85310 RepID=A0A9P0H1M2_NEZVI|nr:unnamed protein product [Nezara viridula]